MTLKTIQCHRNLRNARRTVSFLQTFHGAPKLLCEGGQTPPVTRNLWRARASSQPCRAFPRHSSTLVKNSQPSTFYHKTSTSRLIKSGLLYLQNETFSGTDCRISLRKSLIPRIHLITRPLCVPRCPARSPK